MQYGYFAAGMHPQDPQNHMLWWAKQGMSSFKGWKIFIESFDLRKIIDFEVRCSGSTCHGGTIPFQDDRV